MQYLKHIALTRLGTDSGAADFLRSARPAEAAIAKVFVKTCQQKIKFANFSDVKDARGRRELRVVKISALNDLWRYQKPQKNENEKCHF